MNDLARPSAPSKLALRMTVSLVGGYLFARGFAALITAMMVRGGTVYEDAWLLAAMLVFPVLLGVVIWTFATRRVVMFAAAVGGLAIALNVAAHLLARQSLGAN